MNAADILLALSAKYSPPEYSMFTEVSTVTGAAATNSYADAIVIGLWSGDKNVYCFEVKTSRSDFMKDIQRFEKKQGLLFRNCNLFYYIAPRKVLSPDEVPEGCGLMEVQSGGRIITSRVAQSRKIPGMELSLVRSLSRHILRGVTSDVKVKHSLKFLGKTASPEEIEEYIEKEVKRRVAKVSEDSIQREATRRSREMLAENESYQEVLREYREALRSMGYWSGMSVSPHRVVGDIKKVGELLRTLKDNAEAIDTVRELISRVDGGE